MARGGDVLAAGGEEAAMNWRHISALVLRYTFLYTRSVPRVIEMFFWPVMDLLVWGFITIYLHGWATKCPRRSRSCSAR